MQVLIILDRISRVKLFVFLGCLVGFCLVQMQLCVPSLCCRCSIYGP
jgi:hypothetical protein